MTAKTDIEQERRDFESAYAAAWPHTSATPGKFDRDGQDDYADGTVHVGWNMWQAGRAAMQSQDREDAERYRAWRDALINEDGEFLLAVQSKMPDDEDAPITTEICDSAIDYARRIEGEAK